MRCVTLIFFLTVLLVNGQEPIIVPEAKIHPESAAQGMVVSQDDLATETALKVLKEGGNAADAAVALAYTLAVTQPKAGNIGGGGFALYYEASSGKVYAIDFRETAPQAATEKMYLDEKGKIIEDKSRFTNKAVAVPGTVATPVVAGTMPPGGLVSDTGGGMAF